jgi:hypothetical protein
MCLKFLQNLETGEMCLKILQNPETRDVSENLTKPHISLVSGFVRFSDTSLLFQGFVRFSETSLVSGFCKIFRHISPVRRHINHQDQRTISECIDNYDMFLFSLINITKTSL